jgi:rhodanese-related sulfurtransferase
MACPLRLKNDRPLICLEVAERDIETLVPNKDAAIILYCGGGFRSALAAASLQEMGYTNVRSMEGGIRAWREAGYPLENGVRHKGVQGDTQPP